MLTDCIYFEDREKEDPGYCSCSHRGYYSRKEKDDMCQQCRLWDAYIPKTASDAEKERAIAWQNMTLVEQLANPYETYFKNGNQD
jgi:hypothetical protein